jgi:hypothetical protein
VAVQQDIMVPVVTAALAKIAAAVQQVEVRSAVAAAVAAAAQSNMVYTT